MKRPKIRIPFVYKIKCLMREFIEQGWKTQNHEPEVEKLKHLLIEDGCTFDYINQQIQTKSGINIRYNEDYITTTIYCLFEVFHRQDYQLLFNDDAILIDIGMNIATTSLYFANKPQIKKVYSFEPFKPTYDMAINNINANPEIKNKITTFNYGLGKEVETIQLPYNPEQSGCMSTSLTPFEHNPVFYDGVKCYETVEVKKASECLLSIINKHLNKEKIIVKIDTEGAEFEIFEDLENAKLFQNIDVVMLEYHYNSPKVLEETLMKNDFIVIYKPPYTHGLTGGMMLAFKNKPTLQ